MTGTQMPSTHEHVLSFARLFSWAPGTSGAYAKPSYAVGTDQMKLVRSDSPEVAHCTDSANVRASRRWPAFAYAFPFDLIVLLLFIILSLAVSMRSAAWLGMFFFLIWNAYVLWLTKSFRRNWCAAVCAGQVYVRLYMSREKVASGIDEPDVVVFEASEIASISIRTVEAYLYGPKPKFAECLVIEPAPAAAVRVPTRIPSFPEYCEALGSCGEPGSNYLVRVANEGGRLVIPWRRCRPNVRAFVRQVIRELPSLVIGPEEHSELDLNSIWHGFRLNNLDTQQRQSLLQAKRLGFDSDLTWRLCVFKQTLPREVQAYLAELEEEEVGSER